MGQQLPQSVQEKMKRDDALRRPARCLAHSRGWKRQPLGWHSGQESWPGKGPSQGGSPHPLLRQTLGAQSFIHSPVSLAPMALWSVWELGTRGGGPLQPSGDSQACGRSRGKNFTGDLGWALGPRTRPLPWVWEAEAGDLSGREGGRSIPGRRPGCVAGVARGMGRARAVSLVKLRGACAEPSGWREKLGRF